MSGIMLTLLGSTFGGAKNFIATFNDETTSKECRSIAVCTDSNDNIYVAAANMYDSGSGSTYYRANFKVSNAGELLATKGTRTTGDDSRRPSLKNHVNSNGNYVYSFYGDSGTDFLIHELSGDFSSTVSRKVGSTNNSSADFENVKACVWRPSNDHFYVLRYNSSTVESELMHFNSSYSPQNARNYKYQRGYGATGGDTLYDAGAIAIDSSGNVYTGGSTVYVGYEGTFHKQNSSLVHQWTRTIRKAYGAGHTLGIAIDSNDNPYFCGRIDGMALGFVAKYNSSGTQQWIRFLVDRGTNSYFHSIHIDPNDNIYLGGSISEDGYPNGSFLGNIQNIGVVIKYDTSGTKQWERGICYTNNSVGYSNQQVGNMVGDITTDSEGNVIFAFAQHSSTAGQNKASIRLAKIPADGSMTGTYSGGVDGDVKYAATSLTDTGYTPDYRTVGLSTSYGINRYFVNNTQTIDALSYPTDIAEIS